VPGKLRLHTQPIPPDAGIRSAPSILGQKLPAPAFVVDTHIALVEPREGDRAGLILNAMQYAWVGLRRRDGATQLVYTTCASATGACKENATVVLPAAPSSVYLRTTMAPGASASFAYSLDNVRFVPVGAPFTASKGRWVGAQIGLFSVGTNPGSAASNLDVDYFRTTAQ
jgi:hypothetical protein